MEFFLEASLKGLSKWLRFLGYKIEICKEKISKKEIFQHQNKIFLITSLETARMLEKAGVKYLVLPRDNIEAQLCWLIYKLGLKTELTLDICTVCGEKLISVEKEKFQNLIPPKVYNLYNNFNYCPRCKKLYWEGDHIKRLKIKFKTILQNCKSIELD